MENLKLTIISGSHRKTSESFKLACYVQELLRKEGVIHCDILNLATIDLPFWDEDRSSETGDSRWQSVWSEVSQKLSQSDGFVVVSPEWHGMVPSKLKNLFLLASSGEFSHKPALLVSVSAGIGGAYPIAELRMSSYKNSRICYLPEQIIVRFVKNFNEGKQSPEISDLKERLLTGAKMLTIYAENFKKIRSKIVEGNLNKFVNGM